MMAYLRQARSWTNVVSLAKLRVFAPREVVFSLSMIPPAEVTHIISNAKWAKSHSLCSTCSVMLETHNSSSKVKIYL